ncbi:hypothetical protein [Glycomyces paridis]|nr:hypothetical protein [Glycomyces paridis]
MVRMPNRVYSIWGPVELHPADGSVFTLEDLFDTDSREAELG